MDGPFTFSGRVRSFKHAIAGVITMLGSQHNAWLHALATLVVCAIGLGFGFTRAEWCWIVLAIVAVWTAEALNTAFEFLADVASPDFHPVVKKAKDVAAGAVLISAIGSAVIGALVFAPYLTALVSEVR
jgi:diacylglycerol kinase (ATP)